MLKAPGGNHTFPWVTLRIADTGLTSADTAVSAVNSAARVACRPLAPVGAQRSEYVSDLQRPAAPYVSVGNAGSGSVQVIACEAAQADRPVEPIDAWCESPKLGDTELMTTTAEMSTTVSGAGVLKSQVGKCSDSSDSVSTVHEFVYESDVTVSADLLQPGQRSPPAYGQHGLQSPSQHESLLTSSTPPTLPPVSSESRPPAPHASASQDGQRVMSTQSTERMPGITCSTAGTMRSPLQPTAAANVFADELDAVRRRQHDLRRSSTADTVPLGNTAFLYPQQLQREALRQAARPLRSEASRHGSDHSQESSSTLADRRLSTPVTGYSALRRKAAPLSIAPSLRSHRSRRSLVSGQR